MKTLALRTFLCNTSSITRLSNKVWGATSITKFSAHSPMRHTINRCPFASLSHKNNGPATVDHMRLCVLRLASHQSGVTIHASCTKTNSATIFLPADCRTQVNRTIVFTIRPSPSVTIIIRHTKKRTRFFECLSSSRPPCMDSSHQAGLRKVVTLCSRIQITLAHHLAF